LTKFWSEKPLLHVAAFYENIEICWNIIQRISREDINAADDMGWTALHTACDALKPETKHLEIVRLLIQNNADVNIRTNTGSTALHFLVKRNTNSSKCIAIIRDYFMPSLKSINETNNNGEPPLHSSIMGNAAVTICEFLLDSNADPFLITNRGYTAFHYCILAKKEKHLALLLARFKDAFYQVDYESLRCLATFHPDLLNLLEDAKNATMFRSAATQTEVHPFSQQTKWKEPSKKPVNYLTSPKSSTTSSTRAGQMRRHESVDHISKLNPKWTPTKPSSLSGTESI